VHLDGAYVGPHRASREPHGRLADLRLAENQSPDKRCIVVMRECHAANDEDVGAKRTLTFIVKKETQAALGKLVPELVAAGAVLCADESEAYDLLHAKYAVRRVNHSQAYPAEDDTTINQAEGNFSRLRRMQIGQIHKVSVKYLDVYANEIA